LTVVLGPSNSGKSALVRAITSALFNRSGSYFVRKGEENATVSLLGAPTSAPDRAIDITWNKGKAPASYVINGDTDRPYQKVGKSTPSPVQEAGYKDVELSDVTLRPQVAAQSDPSLFLIHESGTVLVDTLAAASRLDIFTAAVEACGGDLRTGQVTTRNAIRALDTFTAGSGPLVEQLTAWLAQAQALQQMEDHHYEVRRQVLCVKEQNWRRSTAATVAQPVALPEPVKAGYLAQVLRAKAAMATAMAVPAALLVPALPDRRRVVQLTASLRTLTLAKVVPAPLTVPALASETLPVVVAATRSRFFARKISTPAALPALPDAMRLRAIKTQVDTLLRLRQAEGAARMAWVEAGGRVIEASEALTLFKKEHPVCPVCGGTLR
jgi:energy-coupling factor transporter ATP-binding protein EcfA2